MTDYRLPKLIIVLLVPKLSDVELSDIPASATLKSRSRHSFFQFHQFSVPAKSDYLFFSFFVFGLYYSQILTKTSHPTPHFLLVSPRFPVAFRCIFGPHIVTRSVTVFQSSSIYSHLRSQAAKPNNDLHAPAVLDHASPGHRKIIPQTALVFRSVLQLWTMFSVTRSQVQLYTSNEPATIQLSLIFALLSRKVTPSSRFTFSNARLRTLTTEDLPDLRLRRIFFATRTCRCTILTYNRTLLL